MALDRFKKKKSQAGVAEAPDEGPSESSATNPAKAQTFFTHAQTVHETGNYGYAMTLWLQGLRWDPSNMMAFEKFLESSARFGADPKIKGPTSDQKKNFSGRQPVEKYLAALLNWGPRQLDWSLAIKALEAAAKVEANEPAYEIGKRALGTAAEDPKAKKDAFVTLMRQFQVIGAFDLSVTAGEIAIRKDPSDGKLAAEVKNMSAQATMARGGYGKTGEQGGFRENIRDSSQQQALEEEDRLVKTEDVQERVIARAKDDYKQRPTDLAAIQKFAKVLLERAKPEDEKLAYSVLSKGYEATSNFRLRIMAGDIKLRVGRRQVSQVRAKVRQSPDDEALRAKLEEAEKKLLSAEIAEFTERVENMPTDLSMRYELGRRCLKAGDFESAIEHLQQAQSSKQVAQQARLGLAESFVAVGWLDEAESTYRQAIDDHESDSDDLGTQLRYGLMLALQRKAEDNQELSSAEEAFKLASGIAIKQIGYKDIRERRNAIQELVKTLKSA